MSWRRLALSVTAMLLCFLVLTPSALALTEGGERDAIVKDQPYYSQDEIKTCGAGGGATPGTPGTPVDADANQEAIAKIIMGVVKTNNLDQQAALIALITGLAESHLTIYANAKIPLSLNEPHQAVGNDHDSLGVMQQRITAGWSTFSTSNDDINAVKQLMDPAYNAEAFLGAPRDVESPSALHLGLQYKVPEWRTMDPWLAAQKVQVSGTPDGSNYKTFMEQAQSLIDQFWDSSPAVPLPVPFAAGAAPAVGGVNSGAHCFTGNPGAGAGGGAASIVATALKLSWPGPHVPKNEAKPDYIEALGASNPTGVNYGGGADCGVFVATVMRDSKVDPDYPPVGTYVQEPYVRSSSKYTVLDNIYSTADLLPGDILIVNGGGGGAGADGHTLIYVGPQAGGYNAASASGSTNPAKQVMPHLGGAPADLVDDSGRGHYLVARLK